VYELSTGNNAVAGMAWDAVHNSLYAVTECHYMDRLGHNFDYRRAKVPQEQDPEDDELESDDEGYEGRCWPKRAHHGEDYFGYLFDAGDHRICASLPSSPNMRLTLWLQTSLPSRKTLIIVLFHTMDRQCWNLLIRIGESMLPRKKMVLRYTTSARVKWADYC